MLVTAQMKKFVVKDVVLLSGLQVLKPHSRGQRKVERRWLSKRAYIHQVGSEPLFYRNLGEQIQRTIARYGDRPAIVSCGEQEQFSFQEAGERALSLVHTLQKLGLRRGEHLGIWAPNTVQWYVTFLASALGGFPLVCLNPAWQAGEVEYALKKARAAMLITMAKSGKQNFSSVLQQILPNGVDKAILPDLRMVLIDTRERTVFENYDDVLHKSGKLSTKLKEEILDSLGKTPPESACSIQFTSGTTGLPKAAVLTHFSYSNEGVYFGNTLRLHEGHKSICLTVPLFHAFSLGIAMASLAHGSTLVLPSASFNGALALDAVEKECCNVLVGTPTMFIDMFEQQERSPRILSSLNVGLVGGAACSPEVFRKCQSILEIRDMRIGYGMTESCAAVFAQDGTEPDNDKLYTVGKLYPHVEAKVVDANGETVLFGEPGELCLRGYLTMREYMDDIENTTTAITLDGWLKTGDQFVLESNGIGRIVGRKKDVIIRGGENIYPKEIEDFIETHPDVLEAQVIGVPDHRMGEEISAWIRMKPNTQPLTAESLKSFSKGKISHFKVPRYVRIVDTFPKTNSGKIQKFKLQEMFAANE